MDKVEKETPDLLALLSGPLTEANVPTQYTGEQLFSIEPQLLAEAQLEVLKNRFSELYPNLAALHKIADENRITAFRTIDEIVPLLFPHTTYKSYPMALVVNGRFDLMNAWLNDYTAYDLSDLNLSGCQSLDDWLDVVEANTPVRVTTSSGTSGKCSLLPKSTLEIGNYSSAFSATFTRFRDEHGIDDYCGPERFHVRPRPRRSRHNTSVMTQTLVDSYCGDESHVVTLGGEMPTDVLWMTAQMNKARAEGTLEQLKRSKGWKHVDALLKDLELRGASPRSIEEFARDVIVRLKDKPIVLMCGNNFLWTMVECAKRDGVEIRFAPNSIISLAGGAKFDTTSEAQREEIERMIPHVFNEMYGFSETSQPALKCSNGHYHAPPWLVQFVLDPATGAPYPRSGVQTGRFAAFDLWARTYWGGFISGDEVTMNWDGGCPCGRLGPFIHDGVGRFSEKHGSDDKINCQRTAAAVAEMVQHMRAAD